jgi:peroxiredoxin
LAWVLSEEGRGGWLWLDRFGRTSGGGPALLYEREDGKSIVPLIGPLLAPPNAELARGAEWTAGGLDHRVSRQAEKAGRDCWEIDVRSPYGHKRTLWVEQDSGLVVSVRETVFMGQGQEHRLALDLKEAKTVDAAALEKTAAALDSWTQLRDQLGWKSRSLRTELNDQQIATLKTELPRLAASPTGLLAPVAEAAAADAQGQKNRAGAVAALRERAIGKPLGDFSLAELGGKPVAADDVAGKVVVLHFWEYRDAPLEEPYGQTGYLDYLTRRRNDGVAVYGVQVEEQLADEQARRAAATSARKLKAFMNLSYTILQDDGTLLKRIGDPRQAGGKLPLFVVIGADGKIAEFHAGLYEVKTNEGLAELTAAVNKLLPKK